ncbi:hypothetical protein [Methanospirillum sp.]|uniref:hypothetical protein n=1 Tax=Methanospirillum sp. TaxID=45200 RepID=UPI002D0614E2|nr:hypothetical protein [Methanospirillum sp.]HPP77738.1 hypothetical protein [Methanospirillum sp.]
MTSTKQISYVIHIHPSGKIRRQKIEWACIDNCQDFQKNIKIPVFIPWIVKDAKEGAHNGLEAYPVYINGRKIDPFSSKVYIEGKCGSSYTVIYDYLKLRYKLTGIGPYKYDEEDHFGYTSNYKPWYCCEDCAKVRPDPAWCKHWFSQSIGIFKNGYLGMTIPKYLEDSNWYLDIKYSLNTKSLIEISEQYIDIDSYQFNHDNGKIFRVNKIVSDISTVWEFKYGGKPGKYRPRKGTISVYCFYEGNQVVDDLLVIVWPRDGTEPVTGGANFSGVFHAPQTLFVSAYYIDHGKLFFGEKDVNVTPDDDPNWQGPDACVIHLQEAEVGDCTFTLGVKGKTDDTGEDVWLDASLYPGVEVKFPKLYINPDDPQLEKTINMGIVGIGTVICTSVAVLLGFIGFSKAMYSVAIGKWKGTSAQMAFNHDKVMKIISDKARKADWLSVPIERSSDVLSTVKAMNQLRYADIMAKSAKKVSVVSGIFPNSANLLTWAGLFGALTVSLVEESATDKPKSEQPFSPPNDDGEEEGEGGGGGGGNNYPPWIPAQECFYSSYYNFGETDEYWPKPAEGSVGEEPPTNPVNNDPVNNDPVNNDPVNKLGIFVMSESQAVAKDSEYVQIAPLYILSQNLYYLGNDQHNGIGIISYVRNSLTINNIIYTATEPQRWWGFDIISYIPRSVKLDHDPVNNKLFFDASSIKDGTVIVIGGDWEEKNPEDLPPTETGILIVETDIKTPSIIQVMNDFYNATGEGPYYISSPPVGTYNVFLASEGFNTEKQTAIIVKDQVTRIMFKLTRAYYSITIKFVCIGAAVPGLTIYRDTTPLGTIGNDKTLTWSTKIYDFTIFLFNINQDIGNIHYYGIKHISIRPEKSSTNYEIMITVHSSKRETNPVPDVINNG